MKTDGQAEPMVSSDVEMCSPDVRVEPISVRISYEGMLAAAIIGALTISALGMFVVGSSGGPVADVAVAESDRQRLERAGAKAVFEQPSERAIHMDLHQRRVGFGGPQNHDDSALIGR